MYVHNAQCAAAASKLIRAIKTTLVIVDQRDSLALVTMSNCSIRQTDGRAHSTHTMSRGHRGRLAAKQEQFTVTL
jgi:hypothetical protein